METFDDRLGISRSGVKDFADSLAKISSISASGEGPQPVETLTDFSTGTVLIAALEISRRRLSVITAELLFISLSGSSKYVCVSNVDFVVVTSGTSKLVCVSNADVVVAFDLSVGAVVISGSSTLVTSATSSEIPSSTSGSKKLESNDTTGITNKTE